MNLNKLNLNAVKKKQYVVILGLILLLLFVYYLWVYLYELKMRCEANDPNNPPPPLGLCKLLGWVPKPPFYGTKDDVVNLLLAAVVPIAMIFVGALLVSAFPIVAAVLLVGGLIIGTINLYLNSTDKPDQSFPDDVKIPD